MMRRILGIGLAVAAIYAAVLGVAAPAQAPTPDPTVEATATPITTPAPTASSTPVETATATPEATPTTTSTPTPFPSPVETTVATPDPTATAAPTTTPTATPTVTPTATPTGDASSDRKRRRRGNSQAGAGDVVKCEGRAGKGSPSTSARDCGIERPARDDEHDHDHAHELAPAPQLENADGTPAPTNPTYSYATPGPARIGVPNFFIDKFRIPPFLLPIYQAAGIQYGVRWEILAAINEIETDYGRNLNISSAGALGWMQFMPATWAAYGVDANRDGEKDPFNPVDAIFAAARYLNAAGAQTDIRKAVFAYNHANWYVDSVLMRAQVIGGLPSDLVGSLTGLTQGRFPVHAKSTYAGQLAKKGNRVAEGNPAMVVESDEARRGIKVFSRAKAPIVAVNDGRVVELGRTKRLGRYVKLQDVYGNTYTYGHLGEISPTYPAPKDRRRSAGKTRDAGEKVAAEPATPVEKAVELPVKERLFAHPTRPAALAAGADAQVAVETDDLTLRAPVGFDPRDFEPKPLRKGARVIGGTILGKLGPGTQGVPYLTFEIRPAGQGAPRIDPKPILDGWKLLESTAIYRAKGKNPFFGADAANPTIGQLMLLGKEQLARRVVADPRIEIYGCGESDIRSGQIDRRVLATLLYLAGNGLRPTVSSLKCGHGYYTASGNVSHHSTGTAVDIAAINGIVITPATQGPGSITDLTIQRLLKLQGTMKPDQIISLMTFAGADNTLAMGDHHDHIHVGWRPLYGENRAAARQIDAVLQPDQWIKLIDRLGDIDNPTVREQPSKFSVKVVKRASRAHRGE